MKVGAYMNYTDYEQLPMIISVDQLTKILGIGRNTAYKMIRCGKIKNIRCGHQIRITKSSLMDFLQGD